uniref:CDP-diacylglycerol--glycerol-3-phosphate 3-phosphatidyltransferase n=1 Tax=Hirondellea gigas TaxID=1518452 RepID=A0A6A7FQ07_9CRUS
MHYPNCQVSLFHTPELRGFLKWLLPQRWNEVVGLQHMKLYIFDDALLISGANLSADYFTQRQDRYFLLTDVPELTDFFQDVVASVAQHSFLLRSGDTTTMHPSATHHPYKGDYKSYCAAVESSIEEVWQRAVESTPERLNKLRRHCSSAGGGMKIDGEGGQSLSNGTRGSRDQAPSAPTAANSSRNSGSEPPDTIVFPTLQMRSFNINYDTEVTKKLLTNAVSNSVVHLASGYFNLTTAYMKCILHATRARFNILCAHPTANGFLGAAGVAGAIPAAYTFLAKRFMQRVEKLKQGYRVHLWEYQRKNWTFHAKGLWYHVSKQDQLDEPQMQQETKPCPPPRLPCLTLIGSPNFGFRSVKRDLESQLVLVTTSEMLQKRLHEERMHLFRWSTQVNVNETFSDASRYVKLWVRFVVPAIKRFF